MEEPFFEKLPNPVCISYGYNLRVISNPTYEYITHAAMDHSVVCDKDGQTPKLASACKDPLPLPSRALYSIAPSNEHRTKLGPGCWQLRPG